MQVAPRIHETALHLALGNFVEPLDAHERAIALYDPTVSGNGDKGILLTDRRLCSSKRPRKGVYYRDVTRLRRTGSGLLARAGLDVEGLQLEFHTRALRDDFAHAIQAAAKAFRGEAPPLD